MLQRHCECKTSFMTCSVCHVAHSVFWYSSIHVARLRAKTTSLSLNVLMLFSNMEQLAKLHMSIFILLTWIDCTSEFMIKNIKNASKFVEYFKCIFLNMLKNRCTTNDNMVIENYLIWACLSFIQYHWVVFNP